MPKVNITGVNCEGSLSDIKESPEFIYRKALMEIYDICDTPASCNLKIDEIFKILNSLDLE